MNTEHNIYETPESELIISKSGLSGNANQFYVVSPVKYWVLFIATLGMYSIYWFYKNWQLYKISHELGIWPIPRAIFNIFFVHSLFRNIRECTEKDSHVYQLATANMATLYVVCAILSNFSDRILETALGLQLSTLASIVLLIISGYALYKGQVAINLVSSDPDGKTNSSFGIANILWILFGLLLWALVIIGMFIEKI